MRERFEVALVADSEGTSWTGLDARRGQTSLMAFVAEGAFGDDTALFVEPRRSVRTRPGAIPASDTLALIEYYEPSLHVL